MENIEEQKKPPVKVQKKKGDGVNATDVVDGIACAADVALMVADVAVDSGAADGALEAVGEVVTGILEVIS